MDRFRKYLEESPAIIARYSGKYLARAGKTIQLEGEQDGRRLVIIEFPSLEKAKEWEGKAMIALKAGKEDLAKQALLRKQEYMNYYNELKQAF